MKRFLFICLSLWLPIIIGFPISAQIIVVGKLTHIKEVEPGQIFSDTISVGNLHSNTRDVKMYLTDYTFTYDGKKYYAEPGTLNRSNAEWITFSPERVSIPAGETVEIYYTMRVPDDAALRGTYWSILMVEGIPEGSPEAESGDAERTSVGIMQVFRYAIQMVTNIGNSGTRQLKFLQISLRNDEEAGSRTLQIDVENTGERWLRVGCLLELYDDKGAFISKLEGDLRRLYPATSARFNLDLTEIALGTYRALIILDGGGDDVFGGMYTLIIE